MLEHIKLQQLQELRKHRMNLSQLWLLEHFYKGTGSEELDPMLFRSLMRKGFILLGNITQSGKEFYENMMHLYGVEVPQDDKPVVKEEDAFSRLWNAFPRTSTFEFGGKFFQGTRLLRKNEEKCRVGFKKVISEGYKIDEILKALEYEVWARKQGSVEKKDNQMHYMNMLEVWLNQKCFEAYLGMEIPKPKVETPTSIDPNDLF